MFRVYIVNGLYTEISKQFGFDDI